MNTQTCRLCLKTALLRGSHVLPAFVYRWFKVSSATGYIRTVERPNLRVQDGPVVPLLCDSCEQALAIAEKDFSERLFSPAANGSEISPNYGPWLARFAASVCWRGLLWAWESGRLARYEATNEADLRAASERWRTFLGTDGSSGVDPDVHFMPIWPVHGVIGQDVPPNFNRYLARSIQVEVATGGEHSHFVYVKLGPIILLGFIRPAPAGTWEGTAISPTGGAFSKLYSVPEALFGFMSDQATIVLDGQRSISSRQGTRIAQDWRRDLDRVTKSGTMAALTADVEASGPQSVFPDQRDRDKPGHDV